MSRILHTFLFSLLLAGSSACSSAAPTPESETDTKAAKEADAHVDRMAEAHKDDTTDTSPGASIAPATPVTEARVTYATVDGDDIEGFLARPTRTAGPPAAVIVIHEWWGLNDNIKAMTRRVAGEGYVALAVDLYGGVVATEPGEARALMQTAGERSSALEENLRQAYTYLTEELGAPRVGVMGWCFGGGWSLRTAMLLPNDIDAAVIYYGRVVADEASLAPLTMPILAHFGSEDGGIPLEGVTAFRDALSALGKEAQIVIHEGVGHAFANPSGTNYDADAAESAWNQTRSFFGQHLKQ